MILRTARAKLIRTEIQLSNEPSKISKESPNCLQGSTLAVDLYVCRKMR
jgi:hypothetical protein